MTTISVDDQMNTAQEIVKMMEEIDPEGEHAAYSDLEGALQYVEDKLPDVAWLDIEMPEITGLELAKKIKDISPRTNIIFVTGHEKFAYQSFKLHASGFVLKPARKEDIVRELENLRNPIIEKERKKSLRVRCFGNFEVYDGNGTPIVFKRAKSKELLAYLIDRRGTLCSINEICNAFFEETGNEKQQKSGIRMWFVKLREDLKKAGAEDVLVKAWNAYGIDTSKVDCDYYDYLSGDMIAVNAFLGEYMTQYSWAEMTLGELVMKSENSYY